MEDTAAFSALPQEEQQELEQTLSQNSERSGLDTALLPIVLDVRMGCLLRSLPLTDSHPAAEEITCPVNQQPEKLDRRFFTALGR